MKSVSTIETPYVLIDKERLQSNIRFVKELANSHQVNLRPHIKTHKCLEIARLQINQGAVGITASKTDEALVFIENGISSVTVAYPLVVESKVDRLLEASRSHNVDLKLMVDSREGLEVVSHAAKKHGMKIGVFLKIDVGLHRCGVSENDATELAQRISSNSSLSFRGLLSHAGHVYGTKNRDDVLTVARDECKILQRVREKLQNSGIEVKEVSVGSTPTVLASDSYEGITEIRPGNYVFMDRTPLRLGLIKPEQIALSVLATVVSKNTDYFIVDAGSKVFSSDLGAHGTSCGNIFGLAYPLGRFQEKEYEIEVVKLSEEHGFIKPGQFDLKIGEKVRIVPNHACAVANLTASYTVVENDQVVDHWNVAARGRVL